MKSIRQLLRQPLKTLTGILLIATAVAVLCVGIGQGYASRKTQKNFEEMFTTTAVPTLTYQYSDVIVSTNPLTTKTVYSREIPEPIAQWLEDIGEQYPDIVEAVSQPGLASAYIPELIPSNYSQYGSGENRTETGLRESPTSPLLAKQTGAPYSSAVLAITLTELGEPFVQITNDGERVIRMLMGTIDQVVHLQEGFRSPVGYTARLTMVFPDMESAEAFDATVGEQYLIYGMDYFNLHWELAKKLSDAYEGAPLEDIDPKRWHIITEEQWEKYRDYIPPHAGVGVYGYPDRYTWLYDWDVICYRSITMTLEDFGQFYTGTGRQEGLTEADYRERYTTPTIAKLEGTVEEFLTSEEGMLWRKKLENMAVNNHVFPIVGVQDLSWIAEFARNDAEIIQGRSFSPEELESGAKVCVISNILAEQNHLQVGDSICANFFNYDHHAPYQSFVEDNTNLTRPTAYFYSDNTPFVIEDVYTIVGIYEQDRVWRTILNYSFSPNTIFVPETSVVAEMAYGTQGFFYTLILRNGTKDEMESLEEQQGFSGFFSYDDQGYADVSDGLFDYVAVAQLALQTGSVVYAVVILLFLLFYPARERKTLLTMHALGATQRMEVMHIFSGSFAILLLGTILGVVSGGFLWQRLTTMIPASEEVAASYGLDLTVLLGVGTGQLLLVCMLTFVLARFMSRERSGLRKDR